MAYNPYSAYSRRGNEMDDGGRQALIDALDEPTPPPPMTAQPRTPSRTPTQTREMLAGPGGRTTVAPDTDTGNAFSGDRFADERPEPSVYQPPSTTTPPSSQTQQPHTYNPQTGSALFDEYSRPYDLRNEGAGGAGRTALQGMQYGSVAGPVGMGVGALAGAIAGFFNNNAETAMTDVAIENARQMITQAHEDAFGRPITPEYLDQIVRGQGWQDGDRWMGRDSLAYVLDAFAQQAPGERARVAAENAAAAQPGAGAATPGAGAQAGATGGGLGFAGFDFNRAQDPSKSAKDAFAAAAQQAPPMTDTSKAGAEAWFREHIAPQMEAAGYKIYDLQGDKAWVGSKEDPEGRVPVDWLINAGGSNPQIGWQPDSGGGAGGGEMGDAPGDIQGAYAWLKANAHPGMSRAEMESVVAKAFGNVPGFEKAYAGDVVINGKKIDLITDFEGANPQWSDNLNYVPLHGGGGGGASAGGGATAGGPNLAPGAQLAAPLGRSDVLAQIQAELQRLMSGAPPRDELLEALG